LADNWSSLLDFSVKKTILFNLLAIVLFIGFAQSPLRLVRFNVLAF
jgi:hypothetical protein